jgi:hypothetical protein
MGDKFQLQGRVYQIGQQIQGQGWVVQELLIDNSDSPERQSIVTFKAANDKCQLLQNLQPGTQVSVDFYINGKPGKGNATGRFFNNLNIANIQVVGQPQQNVGGYQQPTHPVQPPVTSQPTGYQQQPQGQPDHGNYQQPNPQHDPISGTGPF